MISRIRLGNVSGRVINSLTRCLFRLGHRGLDGHAQGSEPLFFALFEVRDFSLNDILGILYLLIDDMFLLFCSIPRQVIL